MRRKRIAVIGAVAALAVTGTASPPAAAEVVRDGITGFTVEPQDPRAIAAGVMRVLEDPELAKRLSGSGREIVEAEFSARAGAVGHRRALELAVERSAARR